MRRVGLFGGTFDPIHLGHLIVAESVRTQLELEEILFIPAAQSPLKQDVEAASARDRLAMVEIAIASNPSFSVSRVEIERGNPSYTLATVEYLLEALGLGTELFFLVGLDQAWDIPRWKDPERILKLCWLVVMTRPGWATLDSAQVEQLLPQARERVLMVEVPAIGISSTEIRSRVCQGLSIRYLVPEAVEEYIKEQGLYR